MQEENAEAFIAYFDILGFKDMMQKEGHNAVLKKVIDRRGIIALKANAHAGTFLFFSSIYF